MRKLAIITLAVIMAHAAVAQAPGRIQTATRFVTIFSNLENQLWDSLVRNDTASASRLLTDDFAQWSPEPPGSPTPWDQFFQPDRKDMAHFRVRQMSAKDLGDHVVVNYVLTSDLPRAFFIVDVWKKSGADWLLASRYLSAVDAAPYRGDVRPTGKN
jgi:hypothetical protein